MNETDTTPFKALLMTQRATLLAQLATLRGGDIGRVAASAAHFGQPEDSRAQVATERAMELALDDRESTELRAVDAALARIAADSYGVCTDCGADISPARLLAAPEALRCLPCQARFEAAHPAP
jgi:DnaK suppressor protein